MGPGVGVDSGGEEAVLTYEQVSTEVGAGPGWGRGLQLPLAALPVPGPAAGTLTKRRLVRSWMPSESNLQEEGAGTGLACGVGGGGRCTSRRDSQDHKQERRWGGRLPGNVADERLGEVPGEVVGTELRLAHHSGPRLFCRGP